MDLITFFYVVSRFDSVIFLFFGECERRENNNKTLKHLVLLFRVTFKMIKFLLRRPCVREASPFIKTWEFFWQQTRETIALQSRYNRFFFVNYINEIKKHLVSDERLSSTKLSHLVSCRTTGSSCDEHNVLKLTSALMVLNADTSLSRASVVSFSLSNNLLQSMFVELAL